MEWLKTLGRFVCSCVSAVIRAMIVKEVIRVLENLKNPDIH